MLSSPVFVFVSSGAVVGVGVAVTTEEAATIEGASVGDGSTVGDGSSGAFSMTNPVVAEPLSELILNVCTPTDSAERNYECKVIIVLPSFLS